MRGEIAVEDDEQPTRPENPPGLGQRLLRIEEVRVDGVRDDKIKESVRLPGRRSVADRE